jgi:hypothetical protein
MMSPSPQKEQSLEKKILEAIHLKHSKRLVYDLFQNYEDVYATLKNPTPEQHNEYIQLYFKYVGYMEKKQ